MIMAERFELSGVRPRAVIIRFYSDGSYEEFWELTTCVLRMNTYWVRAEPDALPRMIIDTIRLPPGRIPPLPEP
jgi:hypothetical protein